MIHCHGTWKRNLNFPKTQKQYEAKELFPFFNKFGIDDEINRAAIIHRHH